MRKARCARCLRNSHDSEFDPLERLIYRDAPVIRVNVVWTSGTNRIRQWIVFFPLGEQHVLVATATATEAELRDFAPRFAEIIGSVILPP